MGAYKNAKKKISIETLTFERAYFFLAYLYLFTHFESNVNKEPVKGERW